MGGNGRAKGGRRRGKGECVFVRVCVCVFAFVCYYLLYP